MAEPFEGAEAPVEIIIPGDATGLRLDKALALSAESLSRSRIAQLITEGAVSLATGETVEDVRRKVKPGEVYLIERPPPTPIEPQPEAIPLTIVHEDADLIVIDKPADMVVHPAPGAETGTLVNALLHHCGETLTGIGGALRPGIVHRIDRLTSGLLVAAKTDAAHAGLSGQFAAHDIDRRYMAVVWGAPSRADPRLAGLAGVSFEQNATVRIDAPIARHRTDRKRMAIIPNGRHAVTRMIVRKAFGPDPAPIASLTECRLETGRTHQIRVHASYIGHALVGDPVYGRARTLPRGTDPAVTEALHGFSRQALHASILGFRHPVTGAELSFESAAPPDLETLIQALSIGTSTDI